MSTDVVATRAANALIEDAQVKLQGVVPALDGAVGRSRANYGGLWVGGRVTLTTQSVAFHPNAANRGIQAGSLDVEVPLSAIKGIEILPVFVTKIIAIHAAESTVKLRCFRASAFADKIRETARAVGGLGEAEPGAAKPTP